MEVCAGDAAEPCLGQESLNGRKIQHGVKKEQKVVIFITQPLNSEKHGIILLEHFSRHLE